LEILIGIFGLIIAIATFWYSFFRKPKEELLHLKAQFKATQSISKELQSEIEKYISKTGRGDELMFSNISYSSYLNTLKETYKENLSDELYAKLERLNLTKSIIHSMIKSLDSQFSALQHMLIEMRIKNKRIN